MNESTKSKLTFGEVSEVSLSRCNEWDGGLDRWTVSDWGIAMAGEAGEACNAIKKLRRLESNIQSSNNFADKEQAIKEIGKEIGDVFIYLDLLAQKLGLDISDCIVETFNRVSIREGFPHRLENKQ